MCSRYHIHRAISPTPVTLLTITNGEPSSRPSRGEEIDEAPPINKILFGLKGERMWVNTGRALLSERISLKCFMPFVTALVTVSRGQNCRDQWPLRWDSLECRDNRKIGVVHLSRLLSFVRFSVCFLFVYLVVCVFSSIFFFGWG